MFQKQKNLSESTDEKRNKIQNDIMEQNIFKVFKNLQSDSVQSGLNSKIFSSEVDDSEEQASKKEEAQASMNLD